MDVITAILMIGSLANALIIITAAIMGFSKSIRKKIVGSISKVADAEIEKSNEKMLKKIDGRIESVLMPLGELQAQIDEMQITTDKLVEANRSQLKNFIKNTYYRFSDKKIIGAYDKQILLEFYESYKKLDGNHVVTHIMDDMNQWEVVQDSNDILFK